MWRAIRSGWSFFWIAYVFSFLVCWASLAAIMAAKGNYVSVLSWNVFGLEELYRYRFGGLTRTATGPASIVASAFTAIIIASALLLVRSEKWRIAGIIIVMLLGLATIGWLPNPWQNM
jgi:hypothetical protein